MRTPGKYDMILNIFNRNKLVDVNFDNPADKNVTSINRNESGNQEEILEKLQHILHRAGGFSIIVDPYHWKLVKNDDDDI